MGYKYKDEILEDIGPEPNANFDIESERYYQKLEELDEAYRKAKAFDESLKGFKKLERLHEEVQKSSKRNRERSEAYKETLTHVISKMESDLGESGESE